MIYKLQLKLYIYDRSRATVLINAAPLHLTYAYHKNRVPYAGLYWITQCNIIFATYIVGIMNVATLTLIHNILLKKYWCVYYMFKKGVVLWDGYGLVSYQLLLL